MYSNHQIINALHRAADFIHTWPASYNFQSNHIPDDFNDFNTCACLAGRTISYLYNTAPEDQTAFEPMLLSARVKQELRFDLYDDLVAKPFEQDPTLLPINADAQADAHRLRIWAWILERDWLGIGPYTAPVKGGR